MKVPLIFRQVVFEKVKFKRDPVIVKESEKTKIEEDKSFAALVEKVVKLKQSEKDSDEILTVEDVTKATTW